jgi:hypothetical protein
MDKAHTPGSGVIFQQWTIPPFPVDPGDPVFSVSNFVIGGAINDLSGAFLEAKPQRFSVETVAQIKPDRWHHMLLSFDLQPISTQGPPVDVAGGQQIWKNVAEGTSSYATMWYALDDVDYRGVSEEVGDTGRPQHHFGPYAVDTPVPQNDGTISTEASGDPNGILTVTGWDTAYKGSNNVTFCNQELPQPSYQFDDPQLPTRGAALGVPAASNYVDSIYQVEMAELQIFTDVTVDTKDEGSRRAFIDYGDDGKGALKPVDPTKGPIPPAEQLLGKKPEILLHTSENWIAGANTGSMGVIVDPATGEETQIPSGQFQPVGKIKKYTPDPSIAG